METGEKIKEKVAPKKSAESFMVLVGFDLEDGKRFEAGDLVSGLSTKQVESLIKMNAIIKEK